MLIKYHGKLCEINNIVEDGERELDIFDDDTNLEDTVEFPNDFLDNTMEIDLKKINDISKEENYE